MNGTSSSWYDYYLADDRVSSLRRNAIHSRLITLARAHTQLDGTKTVLDIGCGDGRFLARLSDETGCRTHGIEPEDRLVALCRRRGGFTVTQGVATALPYRAHSFHIIFIDNVLHHLCGMNDYTSCFKEAARTLLPGGMLIICEPARSFARRLARMAASLPLLGNLGVLRHNIEKYEKEKETFDEWIRLSESVIRLIPSLGLETVLLRRTPLKVFGMWRSRPSK